MNQKNLAEQIGRRFRNFRVSQGLQQKKIGAMLGVSHGNISRLERGAVHRFGACFLDRCRTEFGLSIDWLLTGQGPMVLPQAQLRKRPPELGFQNDEQGQSGLVSVTKEERDLQKKLDELKASLIRATVLVQELFAHAANQEDRTNGT